MFHKKSERIRTLRLNEECCKLDEVNLDLLRPLEQLPASGAQCTNKPPALDAAYSARLHALVKFASIVEYRTAGTMTPLLTCRAECHA